MSKTDTLPGGFDVAELEAPYVDVQGHSHPAMDAPIPEDVQARAAEVARSWTPDGDEYMPLLIWCVLVPEDRDAYMASLAPDERSGFALSLANEARRLL